MFIDSILLSFGCQVTLPMKSFNALPVKGIPNREREREREIANCGLRRRTQRANKLSGLHEKLIKTRVLVAAHQQPKRASFPESFSPIPSHILSHSLPY